VTLVQFATVASVVFLASFVQAIAGSGRVAGRTADVASIAPARAVVISSLVAC